MHIHYITNTRGGLKVGERNQALGVVDALRATHEDAIILEHDVSETVRLNEILHKFDKEQHIIIGVSDSGVKAFSALSASKRYIAVLIGHEVPEYQELVADKISILAIPSYVGDCPAELKGIKIVRTDGVAHTMTVEKARRAYHDWKGRFPIAGNQPVVVAMLGGTVDGHDLQPAEAERMAEYIAYKAKKMDAYVLASNSPRSTPHDTESFTRTLSDSGCDNVFFPFTVKNQNNETPYRAMVGLAARSPENRVIITGDSVSMPCEIARVVPPEQIAIYPVSNLNRQNKEFIEWMHDSGRAGRVDTGNFTEDYMPYPALPPMDAAGQIAREIGNSLYFPDFS